MDAPRRSPPPPDSPASRHTSTSGLASQWPARLGDAGLRTQPEKVMESEVDRDEEVNKLKVLSALAEL